MYIVIKIYFRDYLLILNFKKVFRKKYRYKILSEWLG